MWEYFIAMVTGKPAPYYVNCFHAMFLFVQQNAREIVFSYLIEVKSARIQCSSDISIFRLDPAWPMYGAPIMFSVVLSIRFRPKIVRGSNHLDLTFELRFIFFTFSLWIPVTPNSIVRK